jgi:hypothetical protein
MENTSLATVFCPNGEHLSAKLLAGSTPINRNKTREFTSLFMVLYPWL